MRGTAPPAVHRSTERLYAAAPARLPRGFPPAGSCQARPETPGQETGRKTAGCGMWAIAVGPSHHLPSGAYPARPAPLAVETGASAVAPALTFRYPTRCTAGSLSPPFAAGRAARGWFAAARPHRLRARRRKAGYGYITSGYGKSASATLCRAFQCGSPSAPPAVIHTVLAEEKQTRHPSEVCPLSPPPGYPPRGGSPDLLACYCPFMIILR